METRKINTRFMEGNIDINYEIMDIMGDKYGRNEVLNSSFDFDNAIYSNGFIHAVNSGLVPVLGSEHRSFESKLEKEYHHVIVNDECFVMYFE